MQNPFSCLSICFARGSYLRNVVSGDINSSSALIRLEDELRIRPHNQDILTTSKNPRKDFDACYIVEALL